MDKCKSYKVFAFELITGQFDHLQNFFQHPWTSAIYIFLVFTKSHDLNNASLLIGGTIPQIRVIKTYYHH